MTLLIEAHRCDIINVDLENLSFSVGYFLLHGANENEQDEMQYSMAAL